MLATAMQRQWQGLIGNQAMLDFLQHTLLSGHVNRQASCSFILIVVLYT